MASIPVGPNGSFTLVVTAEHLANRFKDATLPPGLATPVMIMAMQNAALKAIKPFLKERGECGGNPIENYDQAIYLKPDYADAFNGRCWTRAIANKMLEVALSDCDESLRLRPDDAYTLHSRGFVYFRMGRYDKAIADFDH